MKVLLFGKKHDPAKELEIFHTDVEDCKHGFIAKIVNKKRIAHDGRIIRNDGDIDMCYNITEFHYLYNPNSLALESDIHGTGWAPWDIEERFHSIEITKADKLYPSYDG